MLDFRKGQGFSRFFTASRAVQTASEVHIIFYPTGTWGSFSEDKATGLWYSSHRFIKCIVLRIRGVIPPSSWCGFQLGAIFLHLHSLILIHFVNFVSVSWIKNSAGYYPRKPHKILSNWTQPSQYNIHAAHQVRTWCSQERSTLRFKKRRSTRNINYQEQSKIVLAFPTKFYRSLETF
jgi:hypothetical protein